LSIYDALDHNWFALLAGPPGLFWTNQRRVYLLLLAFREHLWPDLGEYILAVHFVTVIQQHWVVVEKNINDFV